MPSLINWDLIKNPYNWAVILVIVAFAGLTLTAYFKAQGQV